MIFLSTSHIIIISFAPVLPTTCLDVLTLAESYLPGMKARGKMANNMDRAAITTWTLWRFKRDVWRRNVWENTSRRVQKSRWISIPFRKKATSINIYLYTHIWLAVWYNRIYWFKHQLFFLVLQDGTSILALWEEGRRLVWELRMDWAIFLFSRFLKNESSNFRNMARDLHETHADHSISMHFYAFFIISSRFFGGSFWGKTGRSSAGTWLNSGMPWHRHWCSGRPTTRGRQRLRWEFRKLSQGSCDSFDEICFHHFLSHYFFHVFCFVVLLYTWWRK